MSILLEREIPCRVNFPDGHIEFLFSYQMWEVGDVLPARYSGDGVWEIVRTSYLYKLNRPAVPEYIHEGFLDVKKQSTP
jgi:hypothetical protein